MRTEKVLGVTSGVTNVLRPREQDYEAGRSTEGSAP